MSMIKSEINKGTKEGKDLWKAIKSGEAIPDAFVTNSIKTRLRQLDCKINGFILDGFPASKV